MDFEIQTEVWTSPKMRIWTLVQGFNSKDFELQTKNNLGLNKGVRIKENLNSTQDLNSMEGLNIFKEWKLGQIFVDLSQWEYLPNNSGLSFMVLKIKPR